MFLIPKLIEVRKTEECGNGVFAKNKIQGGTVIGDYIGIVTKSDEGEDYEDDAVYDMWYSDLVDICPDPKSDGVHLLNTSCEPNCAMTAIGRHTIIFAIRTIFKGEELTYDYFLGEQDEECEAGSDNCKCGSEFCRGTMYSNPRAYSNWETYLEDLMGDISEEPPVPFGETLPLLDFYPEKIDDHQIYPIWGTHTQPPLECKNEIFSSLPLVRKTIRESGKQLQFPELGIVIEGVTYGGHLVCTKEPQKNKLNTN